MPGSTNNTTILSADNQLIISQNEQTIELGDIEQAILGLSVKLEQIKITIASSGSGSGGSSEGASGIEDLVGIDPIEDFTPSQMNNRCMISNYVYDCVLAVVNEWVLTDFEEYGSVGAYLSSGLVTGFLVISGSLTLGVGVILEVAAVAVIAIILQNIQLDDIVTALTTGKNAIINDLYGSKDIYQAKNAFMNNVSGLSSAQMFILGTLATDKLLKYLFISNFSVPAGYTPTEPCEDLDSDLGEWVAFDSTLSAVPGASTRYYDYFELEAPVGTVYGGGGWADRYYLFAGNTDTHTTTKRRFTIDCLDSSYTIGGITGVSDPLFYSQLPIIQGNTIVPTIITPGKVYEVTGCNYVRVDTIQGSAGLKMKIEVVVE